MPSRSTRPRERCGSMARSVSSRRGARGGRRRRRATRRACWRSTPSWSRAAVRARSLMPEAVAIQGEAGSFSHAAALETRGPVVRLVPCATFVELFRAVETGAAASGVVPIENTLAGAVHENYDLLSAHALHGVAETALRIRHCLIYPSRITISPNGIVMSLHQLRSHCVHSYL